jgi:hypothetical protein
MVQEPPEVAVDWVAALLVVLAVAALVVVGVAAAVVAVVVAAVLWTAFGFVAGAASFSLVVLVVFWVVAVAAGVVVVVVVWWASATATVTVPARPIAPAAIPYVVREISLRPRSRRRLAGVEGMGVGWLSRSGSEELHDDYRREPKDGAKTCVRSV